MNILGLCSYPIESAATRYRLIQYVEPMMERGIELKVDPFLDSRSFVEFYRQGKFLRKVLRMLNLLRSRLFNSSSANKYDIVFVQREAMMFGPPIFEWFFKFIINKPLILDLDDATYVSYISPTLGKMGSALKFFGKTDSLINWSETVICGNRFIAQYVESKGKKAVIMPTVVDTEKFCPVEKNNKLPIIGWIGTHSTFPFLQMLFPVLQNLSKKYDFVLKIVGSGQEKIEIEGLKIENLKWSLEREIEDFQSLDIGLYPVKTSSSASNEWLLGKSGFKAIQYLSVGIPYVVTPLGICREIGVEEETHFSASTEVEWEIALERLLCSADLRTSMGEKGRQYALDNYTVAQQSEKLEKVFRETIKSFA